MNISAKIEEFTPEQAEAVLSGNGGSTKPDVVQIEK